MRHRAGINTVVSTEQWEVPHGPCHKTLGPCRCQIRSSKDPHGRITKWEVTHGPCHNKHGPCHTAVTPAPRRVFSFPPELPFDRIRAQNPFLQSFLSARGPPFTRPAPHSVRASPPFSPLGPCRPHHLRTSSPVPTIPARSPTISRTSITRPVPTDEPHPISIGTIFSSSPNNLFFFSYTRPHSEYPPFSPPLTSSLVQTLAPHGPFPYVHGPCRISPHGPNHNLLCPCQSRSNPIPRNTVRVTTHSVRVTT